MKVIVHSDGGFIYTPTTDFCSVDSFTYYTNEGTNNSNPAVVTLNVSCDPTYGALPVDCNEVTFDMVQK